MLLSWRSSSPLFSASPDRFDHHSNGREGASLAGGSARGERQQKQRDARCCSLQASERDGPGVEEQTVRARHRRHERHVRRRERSRQPGLLLRQGLRSNFNPGAPHRHLTARPAVGLCVVVRGERAQALCARFRRLLLLLKEFKLLASYPAVRSQADVFDVCKETAERALLGFNGAGCSAGGVPDFPPVSFLNKAEGQALGSSSQQARSSPMARHLRGKRTPWAWAARRQPLQRRRG